MDHYPKGTQIGPDRTVGEKIGFGLQGSVFAIDSVKHDQQYVMKVVHQCGSKTMQKEKRIYKAVNPRNSTTGFPNVHSLIYKNDYTGLIMERLDCDLSALKKRMGRETLPQHTVLSVAYQAVRLLQLLHGAGYLHRDIKPRNFMIGRAEKRNIIYLVDMGAAKRFRDNSGGHSQNQDDEQFIGTPMFASLNALQRNKQSRRDDMIALAHTLVYLLVGTLPWSALKIGEMMAMRADISIAQICGNLPDSFRNYFEHVYALSFSDCPDYSFLISEFQRML